MDTAATRFSSHLGERIDAVADRVAQVEASIATLEEALTTSADRSSSLPGLLARVEALESHPALPAAAIPMAVVEESPTIGARVTDPVDAALSPPHPGPTAAPLPAATIPPGDTTTRAARALPASVAPARMPDAAATAAAPPPAPSHRRCHRRTHRHRQRPTP